jgi:predicted Co/Zn/Cd cation transporter (cation efflux family)
MSYLSISCTYQFKYSSCGTHFTLSSHPYNHGDFHLTVFQISIIITIAVCVAICYGLVIGSVSCVAGVRGSTQLNLCILSVDRNS